MESDHSYCWFNKNKGLVIKRLRSESRYLQFKFLQYFLSFFFFFLAHLFPCIWGQVGPCEWHHSVYPNTADCHGPAAHRPQGSLHFSETTKIQNTWNYGHILHICAAFCILFSASVHTCRLGIPVFQLHRRTSRCVSQSHCSVSRNSEGARLWLLSSVCKTGRGTLRSLHPEVLQRAEMLSECRGYVPFTGAPPRLRPVWTKSGCGYHKPRWSIHKW